MKKDYLIIFLRVVIYACTLFLAFLGVSAITSCGFVRDTLVSGRAVIVTTDTTYINHTSTLKYPRR